MNDVRLQKPASIHTRPRLSPARCSGSQMLTSSSVFDWGPPQNYLGHQLGASYRLAEILIKVLYPVCPDHDHDRSSPYHVWGGCSCLCLSREIVGPANRPEVTNWCWQNRFLQHERLWGDRCQRSSGSIGHWTPYKGRTACLLSSQIHLVPVENVCQLWVCFNLSVM